MKRIILPLIVSALFFVISCREEHVSPINQKAKELFSFNNGSSWTYVDHISHDTTRTNVSNFIRSALTPTPKGGRKAYDFAEVIKYDLIIANKDNLSLVCHTSLSAEIDIDNTLSSSSVICTPLGNYLHVSCSAKDEFTPVASFYPFLTQGDILYTDVYVFDIDGTTYFIAKNIGLIRCKKDNYFDLVLIDKKIFL